MTLVVSDSAGAVIAPKSIEASSNPHHDRFAMPRRSSDIRVIFSANRTEKMSDDHPYI